LPGYPPDKPLSEKAAAMTNVLKSVAGEHPTFYGYCFLHKKPFLLFINPGRKRQITGTII